MDAAGDRREDGLGRDAAGTLLVQAARKEAAEQFRQILAAKDKLERSLGQSFSLVTDLTARLKEHEDQVEAIIRKQLGQPAGDEETEEKEKMEAEEEAQEEAIANLRVSFATPEEEEESAQGASQEGHEHVVQTTDEDLPATASFKERVLETRHPELAGRRRLRRQVRGNMDVRALEVCQGWRKRLPEDFSGLKRKKSSQLYAPEKPSRLDTASCILVLFNFVFMIAEVEVDMQYTVAGEDLPVWVLVGNLILTILFFTELLLRVKMEGRAFLCGRNWRWNLFDVVAVMTQLADLVMSSVSVGFIRVFRVVRMIRAVRIIKTARYVRDLRLMIAAIAASLVSLSWAFLIILLTVVLYAMFVLQVVRTHIREAGLEGSEQLLALYSSLPRCMLTLFMSITGGADWYSLVEPLVRISPLYLFTFILFLTFVSLGMLNILTAVFVDSTNKLSEIDSDLVLLEQLDQETSAFNKMRTLLHRADRGGTGVITEKDFDEELQDPRFKAEMTMMDLHVHEARAAFHLLDAEGTGEVDINEMIHGLMRLKGTAKALDMATMLFESKRVCSSLMRLTELTDSNFRDLKQQLRSARVQARAPDPGASAASSTPEGQI